MAAAACLGPVRDRYPPRRGEATDLARGGPRGRRFAAAGFLEVGWGDRAFYQAPDAGVGLAVKAAFASEGSVLHVTGLDRAPPEQLAGADVVPVVLSARGAEALARFVSDAYARDAADRPMDLGPGLYPGSRFYAATGRYSLLYTCNSWIAAALRAAGCPITPAWALTASNLVFQARRCTPA